jgi:MOSC domain-containing protein YiiM
MMRADVETMPDLFADEVEELAGRVEEIYLAPARGRPRVRVESVRAVAGMGLEGDRNFGRKDAPGARWKAERQVTLIEGEAIDAVRGTGRDFTGAEARRNLVTRGVRLNQLVGRTFRVGGALLRGVELCHPCAHLGRLTYRDVVRDLHRRGGLRAEILEGGPISAGDDISAA